MTTDELRRACVVANIDTLPQSDRDGEEGWIAVCSFSEEHGEPEDWQYWMHDPALPAYVAERLVAMVRERDDDTLSGAIGSFIYRVSKLVQKFDGTDPENLVYATPEQKITAALAVLEG